MVKLSKAVATCNNKSQRGWTSIGLESIVFHSKREAERALIYAFGGECGDCGFKSNDEVLEHYPVYRVGF